MLVDIFVGMVALFGNCDDVFHPPLDPHPRSAEEIQNDEKREREKYIPSPIPPSVPQDDPRRDYPENWI